MVQSKKSKIIKNKSMFDFLFIKKLVQEFKKLKQKKLKFYMTNCHWVMNG